MLDLITHFKITKYIGQGQTFKSGMRQLRNKEGLKLSNNYRLFQKGVYTSHFRFDLFPQLIQITDLILVGARKKWMAPSGCNCCQILLAQTDRSIQVVFNNFS